MVVSRRATEAVRRGHPWIFRTALVKPASPPATGDVVTLVAEDGERLGAGLWDAESPIAVRVWTRDPSERVDAPLFRARLAAALEVRARLFQEGTDGGATTAYRVLNGEGDRTPGFVIDRYAGVAVLRIDGEAARAASGRLLAEAEPLLKATGVSSLLERRSRRGESPSLEVRFGVMHGKVEVRENGVPFVVDLAHGQKTGAFLDQRDNRQRVFELVRRRARRTDRPVRVLNLFSYAGGFSVRAALGGAVVTSVDVAMAAHATAQESFRLAGVDPRGHAFVTADCFAWLAEAKRRKERFDVVISDPPSFAPSEKAKAKGLAAYRSLHAACMGVLAEGGTFLAASCSSHVTMEDFAGTLDDVALGRSDLRLLELHGPPPDHPTLPTFPEGRYLKLAVLE
jgi:23S rRNA (cytosine1962-C5)-methyltransferase